MHILVTVKISTELPRVGDIPMFCLSKYPLGWFVWLVWCRHIII